MKNSSICVDASLVIRTLVPGPYSSQAEALLATWQSEKTTLLAPALFAFEVTSTLRRMVSLKAIKPERGDAAFATFRRIPVRLSQRAAIFPLAWELAQRFDRPRAYDTAYLALAQLSECHFWTADERLYNAVKSELDWVFWIGDAPESSLNVKAP